MVEAEKSPEEQTSAVSDCTKRIAFLGTPFQGADKAKWVNTGRSFISSFASTSPELLKDLEKKSEILVELEDSFQQWLNKRDVGIMCFWEELGWKTGSQVNIHNSIFVTMLVI